MQKLKILNIKKLDTPAKVYDLSVPVNHNFFVGVHSTLTSNCDGMSKQSQSILRNVMESYASTTRFILTGNYKHKIIPALQSRCQSLSLHTPLKDVTRRCLEILKKENIQIPENQKRSLIELIRSHYPDIRKCINELEKYSKSGVLSIEAKKDTNQVMDLIYTNLKIKNTLKTRKFLIENEELFDSDHESLLKDLLNYFYDLEIDDTVKKQAILIIADHLYKMMSVTDREICCIACLLQLEELLPE